MIGAWPHTFSASISTITNVDATNHVTIGVMTLLNTTAAVAYLQFFNRAASNVWIGNTSPTWSIGLPANAGLVQSIPKGIYLGGDGLSIVGTTGRTNITAAQIDVNFGYE